MVDIPYVLQRLRWTTTNISIVFLYREVNYGKKKVAVVYRGEPIRWTTGDYILHITQPL